MAEGPKTSLPDHGQHGLRARDPEKEPDLANRAEYRFQQVAHSHASGIASPVYLMDVVDRARSAAQYRQAPEGLKDSCPPLDFCPIDPNIHVGMSGDGEMVVVCSSRVVSVETYGRCIYPLVQ
jgi:hypothetical protein